MNTMTPNRALALLLTFCASAPALASTGDLVTDIRPCPIEFPVEAVKLSPLPPGWVGIRPAKILLTSADGILGPADRPGELIGKRKKTRNGHTVTFEQLFLPASEPVEKWLACRYGEDLALAERLPDRTDRCVVTYVRDAYNGYDIQFACHIKPK